MTRKPITAGELLARLNADPEFVARRERQAFQLRRNQADFNRAERPLVEALKASGFAVGSVMDLLEATKPYPEAIPILLQHLQRPYPSHVRECIARALGVRAAKPAWKTILNLYRGEREERAKDGLAVAIAAIADKDLIEDVIALARDRQIGPSRVLLMRKLSRSRNPKAFETLIELKNDPDLHKEIAIILRRKRDAN